MRDAEAGVTLVETLAALAVVAAMGVAGITLVDALVRVRDGAQGRFDRIAAVERTAALFVADVERAARGSLSGDAAGVSLTRADGGATVRWLIADGGLARVIGAEPRTQRLLAGVGSAAWRYADAAGRWGDVWPPRQQPGAAREAAPRAVELALELTDPRALAGALRLLAEPPAAP